MHLATATVEATSSNPERELLFIRSLDPTATHDGILSITEVRGVRKPRKITELYQVSEQPAIGFAGRVFLVLKSASKGDSETKHGQGRQERIGNVYRTEIHASGGYACTCTAGQCKQAKCIHVLALTQLHESGDMPPMGEAVAQIHPDFIESF